jgi:hypothetical protein
MAGLLVALGSLDKSPPALGQNGMAMIVSGVAILLTVFFYQLDKRNQYLVDCDRALMNEAEKQLKGQLYSLTNFNWGTVNVSAAYDSGVPNHPYYEKISPWTRYRTIVPTTFIIFLLFWLAVLGIFVKQSLC